MNGIQVDIVRHRGGHSLARKALEKAALMPGSSGHHTATLAASKPEAWITGLTTAKKILASGISEHEAIDRAKQGDAECFEMLYGLHKRRVYSLCLRMTGNTAEAEDLTQEAFLQLYRKIATFRGESAFSTW